MREHKSVTTYDQQKYSQDDKPIVQCPLEAPELGEKASSKVPSKYRLHQAEVNDEVGLES